LRYDWLRRSVRATIDRAYAAAAEALERNRAALDALALALFEAGYLDRDDIERVLSRFIFDREPVDQNSASSRTAPADAAVAIPSTTNMVSPS
jgi:hypothetical protein